MKFADVFWWVIFVSVVLDCAMILGPLPAGQKGELFLFAILKTIWLVLSNKRQQPSQ